MAAIERQDEGFKGVAFSRRTLIIGAPLALTACQTALVGLSNQPPLPDDEFDYELAYAAKEEDEFRIPAIDYKAFDRKFWRQVVDYDTRERAGTIVVDPYNNFLYWTLGRDRALRYGIGVGKAGFAWSGDAKVRVKRPWPIWRPPQEMIARRPELAKYWEEGYPRGPKNPLGARAMDLWQGSVDTLYRIHGTPEPSSIGRSVSSGCIRMWHQDVIDLYDRVPLHTKVVVLSEEASAKTA
ncbi:L,D-transpeptidase [Rhizobiales bacterium]|uniref:L,D-transpeptidase n=1 Tax=Hongsoonwoonella zoysiae TaxID=2821844 RepID=UPI0015609541|nr:L,D-transpeptidase [Hongsoonwoonella zoysiae]NRG19510.1 L,D-transpeptidase [Hongsoonwoonella zoysiae]